MDHKKREIQKKYRDEIQKQKQAKEDEKHYTKEVIIVITMIVLFIYFFYTLQGF
ncbi:hypothetical protein P4U97_18920 [Bacillus swezeyi]|uniref:hypothetical protein n=1 Tax=Bacillus swezeyi TaxID=1925020 RepID=UPI0016536C81|nr:hypothetical protein [Bacillus swezeyi]MED1741538.1 hypothetical protein [Bacillus swezeyi]